MGKTDNLGKIISKINESIQSGPMIEPEEELFGDSVKDVFECPSCGSIFKESIETGDNCPLCGSEGKRKDERTEPNVKNSKIKEDKDEDEIINECGDSVPREVELEVAEAMDMLSNGEAAKFNESFLKNARMLKSGKINLICESNSGRMYSVVRKLNSIQRATFKMSESVNKNRGTSKKAISSKRLESVRKARTKSVVITEARAMKVAAMKQASRLGLSNLQLKKMKEALDDVIYDRENEIEAKLEAIEEDKETGMVDFTEAAPEDVASDVVSVIKDTGLEVLTNEVDVDGQDSASVSVRVQDDPELEVNLEDVANTVAEVTGADVAVVGPVSSEADPTIADVTVVINPDSEAIEDMAEVTDVPVALSESLRKRIKESRFGKGKKFRKLKECDDLDDEVIMEEDEDEDDFVPKLSERRSSNRRKLRRFKESVDLDDEIIEEDDEIIEEGEEEIEDDVVDINERIEVTDGITGVWALAVTSTLDTDDIKFLAIDGTIIDGNSDESNAKVKIFTSEDAAALDVEADESPEMFTPVKVRIV